MYENGHSKIQKLTVLRAQTGRSLDIKVDGPKLKWHQDYAEPTFIALGLTYFLATYFVFLQNLDVHRTDEQWHHS